MSQQPPWELMGWSKDHEKEAFEQIVRANLVIPFVIQGQGNDKPGVPIWEFAKRVNGGQHLPTLKQEIGDCVSFGCAQAGMYMSAFEIAWAGQEEEFKRWYPPYIYGMSRVAPDLGNGRLGNSDGSTGAWGAGALQKYGVLFADDQGVPAYSGSVAKQWGRSGPPREFQEMAKDNPVKSVAKLSSVEEIRDALINYHPCTIASMRGFEMQPKEYKGRHVFIPSGSWPHQMCMIQWQDDPFPAAYRLNCYDNETDVLTDQGWFRFSELPEDVRIATLNPETLAVEYHSPISRVASQYEGEMIHFKAKGVDLLVTPNHNMWIAGKWPDHAKFSRWKFATAETVPSVFAIRKNAAPVVQNDVQSIVVAGHEISMDDWLEFLGWFLSEGWASCRTRMRARAGSKKTGGPYEVEETDYYIGIANSNEEHCDRIRSMLGRLPFNFNEKKYGRCTQFVCYSRDLGKELVPFGKAPQKRVPNYVWETSAQQQMLLLKTLVAGDGQCDESGYMRYSTVSVQLADDVQRLALNVGLCADITNMHTKGKKFGKAKSNYDLLKVSIRGTRLLSTRGGKPWHPERVPYKDMVYCVNVPPHHIIYVRRNGKACWCGQSWGESAHGSPLNGEPAGGAWNRAEDLERELRSGDVEVYALSAFEGFPGRANFSPI